MFSPTSGHLACLFILNRKEAPGFRKFGSSSTTQLLRRFVTPSLPPSLRYVLPTRAGQRQRGKPRQRRAAPQPRRETSSNQASPQSLERLAPTQPGRAEWNLAAAEEQNRRKRDSVRAALTLHDINPRSGAALAIRQITSFPAHLCGARPEGVSPSEFIPPMTKLEEALFAPASQVR